MRVAILAVALVTCAGPAQSQLDRITQRDAASGLKAALDLMSLTLASELREDGVTVVAVEQAVAALLGELRRPVARVTIVMFQLLKIVMPKPPSLSAIFPVTSVPI